MNFKNCLAHFSLVFFLLIATQLKAQSGWTQEKGKFFSKLDYSNLSANKYYNPNGILVKTNTFHQSSINFYGEYGITNRLTVISSLPVIKKNSFPSVNPVYGVGDLKIELKYRLTKSDFLPISISIAPEIPIGRSNAYAISKTDPVERINLPIGDGEFNVWSTLAISKSIGPIYASTFASYNYRTSFEGLKFQDLYQIGFELGGTPFKNFWVNSKIKGQFAVSKSIHPELGFLRGDETTFSLFSLEAMYKFTPRFGLSATYLSGGSFFAPLRNIYAAPYYSIGFIYENK